MRGYLAQRIRETRIRRILLAILLLSFVISFFGFCRCGFGEWLGQFRFQIYLLLLLSAVWAVANRFLIFGGMAVLLAVVNFMAISSSVNIWGGESDSGNILPIVYHRSPDNVQYTLHKATKHNAAAVAVINAGNRENASGESGYYIPEGMEKSFIASASSAGPAGKLNLPGGATAVFSTLEASGKKFVLIATDFSPLTSAQTAEALTRLGKFIAACNEPVIVAGNFNLTAWNADFNAFLHDSGLEVKNALLADGRNILFPPKFYVLGYRTLSIAGERNLSKGENAFSPRLIELKI